MSANKENNLVQAYIELNKFCQSGDYDRALKATGKVLQIAPNEQKAFHCKIICLIQLHNFKEALSVLCSPKNAALAADLHFEKAYAQYRLNCPKEALQTVDNAPELTTALKELRAQILYRLEQYQDCYNLYRDIVKNTTDEYEDERKANMSAVVANLAALNPSSELPQFDENTYELIYNAGSTLAMRGKYNEALPVLKRAEHSCSESVIDDGGTEEEAKEEAAIIRVQQAYCLQQMGKEKEAASIYQNVLKDKPSDQALVAIASNNIVVINSFFTTKPPKRDEKDVTAKIIGDFGKWQLRISILMALLKFPIAWYQLNIIFMAPPQDFWCKKPAVFKDYSEKEWRRICCPRVEEHPCLIFDPDLLVLDPHMDKTLIPLVPCPKFIYDTSVFKRTITSDWNLVCTKHWLTHICQGVMMWGIVLGGILFGLWADKYGRQFPLMIGIIIQAFTSFIASVIPWYWLFLCNWFILALASGGIGIISFVISMEVVSGKWRTIIPVIYQLPFGLGNAVMAILAHWFRDWRKLEFALASLSSLYIIYWLWVPESPRWLLATGQTEKAAEILRDIARKNGRDLSLREIRQLIRDHEVFREPDPGFMAFLRSKNMRIKTLLLSMNWFCTGLEFYAFAQYLGSIGGNIFMAVALTGIISTVGGSTCIFVITRYGRKTTVGVYQLVTSICFVLILIIPRSKYSSDWPRLLFAGIGFAGMAGTIPALYLFSGELFPTLGRNVGVSGVTTFARIASMVAPAIVTLDSFLTDLPLMILTVISFAQMLMLLPLPETKGSPLPDTLEQAENF